MQILIENLKIQDLNLSWTPVRGANCVHYRFFRLEQFFELNLENGLFCELCGEQITDFIKDVFIEKVIEALRKNEDPKSIYINYIGKVRGFYFGR